MLMDEAERFFQPIRTYQVYLSEFSSSRAFWLLWLWWQRHSAHTRGDDDADVPVYIYNILPGIYNVCICRVLRKDLPTGGSHPTVGERLSSSREELPVTMKFSYYDGFKSSAWQCRPTNARTNFFEVMFPMRY